MGFLSCTKWQREAYKQKSSEFHAPIAVDRSAAGPLLTAVVRCVKKAQYRLNKNVRSWGRIGANQPTGSKTETGSCRGPIYSQYMRRLHVQSLLPLRSL
jgi:hypothetical protein